MHYISKQDRTHVYYIIEDGLYYIYMISENT